MSGSDTDGAIGVSTRILDPSPRGVEPRDRALRPGVAQRPGDGPPRAWYSTGMPAGSRLPACLEAPNELTHEEISSVVSAMSEREMKAVLECVTQRLIGEPSEQAQLWREKVGPMLVVPA